MSRNAYDLYGSIDVMKSLLLSGYGCSIKVKDTRLIFSQDTRPFNDKKEVLVRWYLG